MERTLWTDERLDDRFERIEKRFDGIEADLRDLRAEIAALRRDMFHWMLVQTGATLTLAGVIAAQSL
jgi:chaperonin cofactor prefoldin